MLLTSSTKTTLIAVLLVAATIFGANGVRAFDIKDRTALWFVVNGLCRPMQRNLNLPAPCLKVDKSHGFAVLRAPGDETQILVVPTTKIEGIEVPPSCGTECKIFGRMPGARELRSRRAPLGRWAGATSAWP